MHSLSFATSAGCGCDVAPFLLFLVTRPIDGRRIVFFSQLRQNQQAQGNKQYLSYILASSLPSQRVLCNMCDMGILALLEVDNNVDGQYSEP